MNNAHVTFDKQELTYRMISLCRAADEVLGEDVMAASYGDSHIVLVVLKYVAGHAGVERLHHCRSRGRRCRRHNCLPIKREVGCCRVHMMTRKM